jgi:hypothetical protein
MTRLWRVDVEGLAPPTAEQPSRRELKIGSEPLIDLAGLKEAIRAGALTEVWLATRKAENNLEDLVWTFAELLECIACLHVDDHRGAEWCRDRNGNWHPCDAYAIRYDHLAKCRVRSSSINYYLKFSLDDDGMLTLVVISCHL